MLRLCVLGIWRHNSVPDCGGQAQLSNLCSSLPRQCGVMLGEESIHPEISVCGLLVYSLVLFHSRLSFRSTPGSTGFRLLGFFSQLSPSFLNVARYALCLPMAFLANYRAGAW